MKIGKRMQNKGRGIAMKNNKGMSLIEIIIVIAILAILTTGALGGMNYIRYGNAKSCAYEINAALDKVRMEAMSKAEKPYLYIYQFNGSYYMMQSTAVASASLLNASGTRLGNQQLILSYETTHPASEDISRYEDGKYMAISFDKTKGGISTNPSDSCYYKKILIKDSDGTVRYTITLIRATGKHYVE